MNNFILRVVLLISMCMTFLTLSNPIEIDTPVLKKRLSGPKEVAEAIEYNNQYTGGIYRNIVYNGNRALDIYYDKATASVKKPVLIYILGGAWISGDKALYTDLGAFVSKKYVVVIPNYILFPTGKVEDIVQDVYKSIQWTFKNISKYGGDASKVSIVGHSSGAHITALTLIKSSLKLANNGTPLSPLPTFENTVLLHGPYDFDVFSLMRKTTNKTPEGSLIEQFAELLLGSKNSSPTDILEAYANQSAKLTTKAIHIVNSGADEVVPVASGSEFYAELKRSLPTSIKIKYTLLNGYTHNQLVNGVCYDYDNDRSLFLNIVNNSN